MLKGGIGIIASERNNFSWHFIQSLLNLLKKQPELEIIYCQVGNQADARNFVLKVAKDKGLDYVCMIDSDMTFKSTDVLQLLDTMESFKGKVGAGLYFGTFPPYSPMCSELNENGFLQPIKDWSKPRYIDACGMGFTIIHKDLFDITFEFTAGIGEDHSFCKKVALQGHNIVLDPNIRCGHLRVVPIDEEYRNKIYLGK
jgi:hypothetical protein